MVQIMYKIGDYQLVDINDKTQYGYMVSIEEAKDILLPFGEVLGDVSVGESVMVFVYLDTKDRLVATMNTPLATVGEIAYLKLVDKTDFGYFLDMGLKRDLFMPLKACSFDVELQKKYLVYIYVDKSNRLCATTKVYDYLSTDHAYKANDQVVGTIIRDNPEIGVYVAVDNKFKGMIPKNEYFGSHRPGTILDLRVIRVREDNKLDLATRKRVEDQISIDAEIIYSRLLQAGDRLEFHDKTDPEVIRASFSMSKKAFKRALGRLMKEAKIEMYEDHIEKI